jgi:two-component system, LytTR family, sensor kinase
VEDRKLSGDAGPPVFRVGLAIALVCLILGGISALEVRRIAITHGVPLDWFTIFASRMPGWMLLAAALPLVFAVSVRVPIAPVRARVIVMHLVILGGLSFAYAAVDAWSTGIEAPAVRHMFAMIPRLTRSWYNTLPTVASTYAAVLFGAWGIVEARERQRRTLRGVQLEAQLQTARLAALRAQLQPHFLYNTLNGIAALVTDVQPARAVAAIEQLGELLHASLREDGRDEVTIAEEVALAERYLALQEMRFGERLRYEMHVTSSVADALVPVLILQPVIENAVIHGLDAGQNVLHVRVDAMPHAEGVEISIQNDGPEPLPEGKRAPGHGVGLAATRARLITAHGDRASLTLLPRDGGGAVVRIVIPRKTLAPPLHAAASMQGAT